VPRLRSLLGRRIRRRDTRCAAELPWLSGAGPMPASVRGRPSRACCGDRRARHHGTVVSGPTAEEARAPDVGPSRARAGQQIPRRAVPRLEAMKRDARWSARTAARRTRRLAGRPRPRRLVRRPAAHRSELGNARGVRWCRAATSRCAGCLGPCPRGVPHTRSEISIGRSPRSPLTSSRARSAVVTHSSKPTSTHKPRYESRGVVGFGWSTVW